eukprot:UC1_evm1s213
MAESAPSSAAAAAAAAVAPRQTPLTCSGHTRPVVDLHFSPITSDGFFVISACKDGKPMLRQGNTGDWLGTFEGHKGAVWAATLDPPALRAATGSADFSAKIWDAISGEELHSFSHPHIVKSVAFSPDSTRLLTGCNDKKLRVFDLKAPDAAPLMLEGHTGNIKRAIFSPDQAVIISGSSDKTVRVWNSSTGALLKTLEMPSGINDLLFSFGGDLMVVCHGKTVLGLETGTLKTCFEYTMSCNVYSACVHPEGRTLVWGGEDNYLHVCDVASGKQSDEYRGHFGPVHCVRFSPDGEIYASGSEDGTVRLWQTTVGKNYGLWEFAEQ